MREKAPDGLPIYELGDPEAPLGIAAFGGGYIVVRPPEGKTEDPLAEGSDTPVG